MLSSSRLQSRGKIKVVSNSSTWGSLCYCCVLYYHKVSKVLFISINVICKCMGYMWICDIVMQWRNTWLNFLFCHFFLSETSSVSNSSDGGLYTNDEGRQGMY